MSLDVSASYSFKESKKEGIWSGDGEIRDRKSLGGPLGKVSFTSLTLEGC